MKYHHFGRGKTKILILYSLSSSVNIDFRNNLKGVFVGKHDHRDYKKGKSRKRKNSYENSLNIIVKERVNLLKCLYFNLITVCTSVWILKYYYNECPQSFPITYVLHLLISSPQKYTNDTQ